MRVCFIPGSFVNLLVEIVFHLICDSLMRVCFIPGSFVNLLVEIVFHLICESLMRVVWVNGGWRLSQQDRAAP